jgi:hypothetical protein
LTVSAACSSPPATELCQIPSSCDAAAVTDDLDAACRRALGFLELGMPEDAIAELDANSSASCIGGKATTFVDHRHPTP